MLRIRGRTQNLFKTLQDLNGRISESGNNALTKVENKVKGTFMENWLKYWKSICKDYRDVALDVCVDVKEKPLKATMIASSFGGIYYCAVHNPDEKSFRDAFLKAANDLLLVHPSLQKREAVDHLGNIEKNFNAKQIRRLNLGVASIIWTDRYSDTCNVYEAQCTYLQLQYNKFRSRIVDIGFLDKWWILSEKIIDYDVNY